MFLGLSAHTSAKPFKVISEAASAVLGVPAAVKAVSCALQRKHLCLECQVTVGRRRESIANVVLWVTPLANPF